MAENMTLAGNNEFKSWLSQLKKDIRSAQVKAAIKVNTELLRLYWRMGADICEKQKTASWGDGWLKELSRELMAEFPDMKGFSYRNMRYIRQWYEFYKQRIIIWQQPVTPNKRGCFLFRSLGTSSLLNSLDTDLYERQGKAVNNFNRLLAEPQSELAVQTLKDPYNFDFLTFDGEYRERE